VWEQYGNSNQLSRWCSTLTCFDHVHLLCLHRLLMTYLAMLFDPQLLWQWLVCVSVGHRPPHPEAVAVEAACWPEMSPGLIAMRKLQAKPTAQIV
jgi:hypothetical protein